MLHSFRARLLSGFAIVIILTLILSASAVAWLLREQQAEAAEARIGLLVGPITEGAREREVLGWPPQLIRAELVSVATYYDIRILMLDDDQRVIIDTEHDEPLLGEVLDVAFTQTVAAPGQMSTFRSQRQRIDGEDLYLFISGSTPAGQIRDEMAAQQLIIAIPAGDVAGAWARLLPRLSAAGIGAAIVAVIFALLFASRITTPIAQITRASEAMGRGDLNQRIEVNGDDEVGRLATAFNTMSARISRSDRSM
ncbi:MAG: HAMP domain-containing protein, partial [Dehalococcoidia bacterium]